MILAEFAEISKKPVSERELRKAKEFIKGRIILSWEDSRTVAFSYGTDEILENKIRTIDEYLKRIDEVKAEDIKRVAQFLFSASKLNLAVIGPFKDPLKFQKLLKF